MSVTIQKQLKGVDRYSRDPLPVALGTYTWKPSSSQLQLRLLGRLETSTHKQRLDK